MADCPISSLRLQEAGALAAVGCADGATTLLRLCDGLVDAQPAEKQTLAAVRSLSCASVTASLSHTLRGQGSLVYIMLWLVQMLRRPGFGCHTGTQDLRCSVR